METKKNRRLVRISSWFRAMTSRRRAKPRPLIGSRDRPITFFFGVSLCSTREENWNSVERKIKTNETLSWRRWSRPKWTGRRLNRGHTNSTRRFSVIASDQLGYYSAQDRWTGTENGPHFPIFVQTTAPLIADVGPSWIVWSSFYPCWIRLEWFGLCYVMLG